MVTEKDKDILSFSRSLIRKLTTPEDAKYHNKQCLELMIEGKKIP